MEDITEKVKVFWYKTKAFMLKKWMGVPMYIWIFSPLVLIVAFYSFLNNRPRKNKL